MNDDIAHIDAEFRRRFTDESGRVATIPRKDIYRQALLRYATSMTTHGYDACSSTSDTSSAATTAAHTAVFRHDMRHFAGKGTAGQSAHRSTRSFSTRSFTRALQSR